MNAVFDTHSIRRGKNRQTMEGLTEDPQLVSSGHHEVDGSVRRFRIPKRINISHHTRLPSTVLKRRSRLINQDDPETVRGLHTHT